MGVERGVDEGQRGRGEEVGFEVGAGGRHVGTYDCTVASRACMVSMLAFLRRHRDEMLGTDKLYRSRWILESRGRSTRSRHGMRGTG